MSGSLTSRSSSAEIAAFLAEAERTPAPATTGRGRLIFALDATMSRQPMWDLALALQTSMFDAAASVGGLDVQLVYFRGQDECRASSFVSQGKGLAELMGRISVRGGLTQIRKVLAHARDEAKTSRVGALAFVGDAMEEPPELLAERAGELALAGVKAFMFQEGEDKRARASFQEIARLTGGAYGAFDAGAATRLAALLRAAAAYAAGGRGALEALAAREAGARAAHPNARLIGPGPMPQLLIGLFALYLLLMAVRQFGRITPQAAAKIVRGGGYALGIAAMLVLLLRGSFGLFGALASVLFAGALRGGVNPFAAILGAAGWGGAKSHVSVARSAAVEMQLDRRTGRMSGFATAGPFPHRALESLTRAECIEVYDYCRGDDPEGATLLEAYLDRRFPGWRQAQQGQADARGSAWSGGALSRDEAYEVLGLPKGAGREEIVAAHRSLMKKLHPDHGGSTALAARVNQAKDVLLG